MRDEGTGGITILIVVLGAIATLTVIASVVASYVF